MGVYGVPAGRATPGPRTGNVYRRYNCQGITRAEYSCQEGEEEGDDDDDDRKEYEMKEED